MLIVASPDYQKGIIVLIVYSVEYKEYLKKFAASLNNVPRLWVIDHLHTYYTVAFYTCIYQQGMQSIEM